VPWVWKVEELVREVAVVEGWFLLVAVDGVLGGEAGGAMEVLVWKLRLNLECC
jgi:hypothetical protein